MIKSTIFTVMKNEKMKVRILIGITFGIQLIAIAATLLNYLSFTNTLANNINWQVTKTQLFIPGTDGEDFKNKLPALAKNALNLSAWRGWHEVGLKKHVPWKSLSLRFLPSKDSYLYVIFHKTDKEFSAIRISYSPLYRSALISAKYTGEFTEYIPVSIPQLDGTGWQNLSLKKNNSTSQDVEVWYNKELITTYHSTTPTSGNIAFRAGRNEILVDDLKIKDDDDQILLDENFNGLKSFGGRFLILSFCSFFIDFEIWFFLKKRKRSLKPIVRLNFIFCLTMLLVNLIFLICGPQLKARYNYQNSFAEKLREKFNINSGFDMFHAQEAAWLKRADEELFSTYPSKDTNKTRIMVIGSSQTRGEGISLADEDFVSQFAKLLNKNCLNPDEKFEVINVGRDGQTAEDLFIHFKNQWIKLKPEIVIVNLSSNDEEYEDGVNFANYLEEFAQMSQKYNFKLIFVAEAVSVEYKQKLQTHQIMQKVAEEYQITFINMHEYLADHLEEGILWWDFVHPTSFGYQLIADHLYESLQEELIKKTCIQMDSQVK